MGAIMAGLPEGFTIDQPHSPSSGGGLPPGFTIDAPAAAPSVGTDIVKSGGVGLGKGMIDFAGLRGDAANLLTKGSKAAGDYIGGMFGAEPSPDFPQHSALDYLTSGGIQKAIESKTGEFYKP